MAIVIPQSLSATHFSCSIPDVVFTVGTQKAAVVVQLDGETVYTETLYAEGGVVTVADLHELVTYRVRQALKARLSITLTEEDSEGKTGDSKTVTSDIVYCTADFTQGTDAADASDFVATHFLTILQGRRLTAMGRLEFLHFIGEEEVTVTATYDDLSTKEFGAVAVQRDDVHTTVDVSPDRFTQKDKTLVAYVVEAGGRVQWFDIDFAKPDCAPVLIFSNCFGCDELLYCTGTHTVAPTYKRSQARIRGRLKNYLIEETRTFKANTGPLTTAMADWVDELFRSDDIRVVNFYDGEPSVGKGVVITESKSERTNELDELPSVTFSYQYEQANHNVVDLKRRGRIFDNTFDNTFN